MWFCQLGSFRILTKLHKEEFSLRPIVNCRNHPTSNISMLVDIILKNFVKNSESFILDSQNLIQKLYRSFLPSDYKIFIGSNQISAQVNTLIII